MAPWVAWAVAGLAVALGGLGPYQLAAGWSSRTARCWESRSARGLGHVGHFHLGEAGGKLLDQFGAAVDGLDRGDDVGTVHERVEAPPQVGRRGGDHPGQLLAVRPVVGQAPDLLVDGLEQGLGGRRPGVEDDDLEQGRVTDEEGVLAEGPQLARDVGHIVVPVDEPRPQPARVPARQRGWRGRRRRGSGQGRRRGRSCGSRRRTPAGGPGGRG